MALLQLAGGIELDIASGSELRDSTRALSKLIDQGPARPIFLPLAASVLGTGSVVTLDCGAPPIGRTWNVLAVTFVGNDDHGSVPSPVGFCAMYFGDPANPSLAQLKQVKIALPSTVYPSSDAHWCAAGEHVFFVTDKAVNSPDQVMVTVSVAEYRARELEQTSGRP